ncbi:hypothetical protein GCM10010466_14200 [Planomonospora alba]|uniref:Uncharacterized protein n=1 Tax=Planomonospora alba TaxID=161354 RepID=A0ABP6MTH9_9ACTN
MSVYGRDEETWERLVEAGLEFLTDLARRGGVTSYTDLNLAVARRTGTAGFDFSRADERAAMGHLLGRIVERSMPATGLMLSALVRYLDQNDAGPGFYALAGQYGLVPPGLPPQARWEFWVKHVTAVHEHYSRAESASAG